MDKNRYDTRKRRDSGGIPPYMKIEGSDAFSCIRSGMGLDRFMPVGPGRYCLYSSDYSPYWMVGRIAEFDCIAHNSDGFYVIVETGSGLQRVKFSNIRGLLTDEGIERIQRYSDTRLR